MEDAQKLPTAIMTQSRLLTGDHAKNLSGVTIATLRDQSDVSSNAAIARDANAGPCIRAHSNGGALQRIEELAQPKALSPESRACSAAFSMGQVVAIELQRARAIDDHEPCLTVQP